MDLEATTKPCWRSGIAGMNPGVFVETTSWTVWGSFHFSFRIAPRNQPKKPKTQRSARLPGNRGLWVQSASPRPIFEFPDCSARPTLGRRSWPALLRLWEVGGGVAQEKGEFTNSGSARSFLPASSNQSFCSGKARHVPTHLHQAGPGSKRRSPIGAAKTEWTMGKSKGHLRSNRLGQASKRVSTGCENPLTAPGENFFGGWGEHLSAQNKTFDTRGHSAP